MQQQQKLDALHKAGQELAAMSPDQLADMSIEERVELLKVNIRRFTHDLLHYDVSEIRLLDRQTGRLEPLLAEGMTAEASQRAWFEVRSGRQWLRRTRGSDRPHSGRYDFTPSEPHRHRLGRPRDG